MTTLLKYWPILVTAGLILLWAGRMQQQIADIRAEQRYLHGDISIPGDQK